MNTQKIAPKPSAAQVAAAYTDLVRAGLRPETLHSTKALLSKRIGELLRPREAQMQSAGVVKAHAAAQTVLDFLAHKGSIRSLKLAVATRVGASALQTLVGAQTPGAPLSPMRAAIDMFNEGREFQKQGHIKRAVRLYEQAILADADMIPAYRALDEALAAQADANSQAVVARRIEALQAVATSVENAMARNPVADPIAQHSNRLAPLFFRIGDIAAKRLAASSNPAERAKLQQAIRPAADLHRYEALQCAKAGDGASALYHLGELRFLDPAGYRNAWAISGELFRKVMGASAIELPSNDGHTADRAAASAIALRAAADRTDNTDVKRRKLAHSALHRLDAVDIALRTTPVDITSVLYMLDMDHQNPAYASDRAVELAQVALVPRLAQAVEASNSLTLVDQARYQRFLGLFSLRNNQPAEAIGRFEKCSGLFAAAGKDVEAAEASIQLARALVEKRSGTLSAPTLADAFVAAQAQKSLNQARNILEPIVRRAKEAERMNAQVKRAMRALAELEKLDHELHNAR